MKGPLCIPLMLAIIRANFVRSSTGYDIPPPEGETSFRLLQQYHESLFRKTGRTRTRGRGQYLPSTRSKGGGNSNPYMASDFYNDILDYDHGSDQILLQSDATILAPLSSVPILRQPYSTKSAKEHSKSANDLPQYTTFTINTEATQHDNYRYVEYHEKGSKSKSETGKGKGGKGDDGIPGIHYPRPPKGSKTCKSRKSKGKGHSKDQEYYYDGKQKQPKRKGYDGYGYSIQGYGDVTRPGLKSMKGYVYQAGKLRPIAVNYKDASWSARNSDSSEDSAIAPDVERYYYYGDESGGKGKGNLSKSAKSEKSKGSKSQKYRHHLPYDYQHEQDYYDGELTRERANGINLVLCVN